MWIAFVDLIFFSFLFNIFSIFFDSLYSKLRYGKSRIRIDQSWEHVIYAFLHCLQKMEHGLKQWT